LADGRVRDLGMLPTTQGTVFGPCSPPGRAPDLPGTFTVTGLALGLNFRRTNSDALTLDGTLPPAAAQPNAHVTSAAGGAPPALAVDSTGRARTGNAAIRFLPSTTAGQVRFRLTLVRASLVATLVDEQLDGSATVRNAARKLAIRAGIGT